MSTPSSSKPGDDATHKSPAAGGLGNVLKTLTKPFKSSPSVTTSSSPQINPTVLGNIHGIEIRDLLAKLGPNQRGSGSSTSTGSRVAACELIRSFVETSSVSSVPEIWYAAKDMVDSKQPPECRRAGWRLLKACINYDEYSVATRVSYYRSIVRGACLEDFDLQLSCLKALTNDGRNVLDLSQAGNVIGYSLPRVLISWMRRVAGETQEIRVGKKKDMASPWTTMEENFHSLLRFAINVLKFNIAVFNEPDLEAILKETVGICRKTSKRSDISVCCDLIDTVMVYGYLPMENLCDILEILCGITITVEQQADQAWQSVLNLTKSHTGNNTVMLLCRILEGSNHREVNSNTMRGAARFLVRLIELSLTPGARKQMVEIPIPQILSSLRISLNVESVRHGLEVCTCLYTILSNQTIRDAIPYEVWESSQSSPLESVYLLSQSPVLLRRSRQYRHRSIADSSSGDDVIGEILEKFQHITSLVAKMLKDKRAFSGPYEMLISFLLDMSAYVDDQSALTVISSFEADHYCNPLSKNWADNLDTLVAHFWDDHTWGTEVRSKLVKLARSIFSISRDICEAEVISKLTEKLFGSIAEEQDEGALVELLELFAQIAVQCDLEPFERLCNMLMTVYNRDLSPSNFGHEAESSNPKASFQSRLVARSLAQVFVLTFRFNAVKATSVYMNLAQICRTTMNSSPEAFVEAARVLCRIRVTTDNWVYLTAPNNMDGLAATVGRSYSTHKPDGTEFWWYPEDIAYLSQDNLETPSAMLKRSASTEMSPRNEIDISRWLNIIVDVLENGAEWEAYSFVLAHLGPQLSNIQLFCVCSDEILQLRKVLCEQISNAKVPVQPPQKTNAINTPQDLPASPEQSATTMPPSGATGASAQLSTTHSAASTKLDILVAQIRTMSSVIGYSSMIFTKRDMDFIVQAFVLGLSSWEKTAVPCIHGLVVCCYEFPLSIKKFMGQIFTKFQTKITTTTSSPHILEFLLSLARLPSLTDNFTLDEYKRVFGMAFKYIQHAYDLERKPVISQETASSTTANTTTTAVSAENNTENNYLSQYLLALAYNVIANWFLTLRRSSRHLMATFITRNLILANGTNDDIDEQSLATLDLIYRFTHSDLDLVMQSTTSRPIPQNYECKRWVYGTSIVSIESNVETGKSQIVVRRPTGTIVLSVKPDEKTVPQRLKDRVLLYHTQQELDKEDKLVENEPYKLFSPSYMLLQLARPVDPYNPIKPLLLSDDPAIHRALGAFDRTPVVDFHKIGVLYIAPGQNSEQEFLGNTCGSRAFRRFMSRLGRLVRLKNNKQIYSGGLDTENNVDGEFAYTWTDKITQVIFHTTTLMPNNPHDVNFSSKKRHIGNDYVCIYYDESSLPFNFEQARSSQFNFVNIVISPHTVAFSESDTLSSNSVSKNFYRVRAYRRDGVPAVFAACHMKTVSEESLPVFVRNLALMASKFATVWHSNGQYISNWRYRLQQIRLIESRRRKELEKKKEEPNFGEDGEAEKENEYDLELLRNMEFASFT
ncbi:hypothetical protein TRVA0_013S00496 [Trichomonascus vanleenenianus]|uniref:uncharacterized protein n=1 Tax=Trichomonascus vanleenenianus TaxID=2268995 RepID=UPI003ECA9875